MGTRSKKPPTKKVTADRTSATASPSAMAERGKVIAQKGPQSPLWKTNTTLAATGQDAINACAKVEADITNVTNLDLQAAAARDELGRDAVTATSKLNLYMTAAEDTAKTPKDMQDLGMNELTEHNYTLASPLELKAKGDPTTKEIAAQVKRAQGMQRCVIEISSDLTMQTNVKQFPGDGARQKMGPFAPGTYALRAYHTRANGRSAPTAIITVVMT